MTGIAEKIPQQESAERKAKRLLMVYDAPSGAMAALMDSVKKVFGYGCELCAITHGLTGKREEWQNFENEIGTQIDYLHHDEIERIEQKLQRKLQLPSVLVEFANGEMEELLSPLTIKNLKNPNVPRFIGVIQMWAKAKDISL